MISSFLNKIALIISMLFSLSPVYSQIGRLPTEAEIAIKTQKQQEYLSESFTKSAPSHLLTTGPEQNCMNAITVCQQSYTQANSYTGPGSIQEVNNTCLMIQESNSVWYVFTAQNAGTFTFILNTPNDYDFALYDITSIGCVGVSTATPIRCNYSATYGNTGLVLPASAGNLSYNASQAPTMDAINVTTGQTFALIIDNFSANANGYTLTFGGTAQIFDNTPPLFTIANAPCGGSSVNVNFSEFISCSSIASDGSDFTITGPSSVNIPVTSINTGPCVGGASSTNSLSINFNNTGVASGIYTITVGTGSDGNTVFDQCSNSMLAAQTVTFAYLGALTISATNTLICAGSAATLSVSTTGNPTGLTYAWAPVSNTTDNLTDSPITDINYIATVSYQGCSLSISQLVQITLPPIVTVNPNSISLCSGTANVTATSIMGTTPCINCNYTWSGSSTQVDNNVANSIITGVGAGSYTVTVSSNNGCVGNSAVSNISIISPSTPPSCNVIYVSPTGGGSGLIPTSPTIIQTAITMAACNNVVIKMQIGDYTINAPLNVGAFTTIEGGYNVGFTIKTSAKAITGGFPLQGTRIIRSTLGVEGSLGNFRYTAINLTPFSSNFRLQDLRIDMPDNIATSAISNYGVYLGSGCNNYNITRCYIYTGNAGSGTTGVNSTAVSLNGGNGGYGTGGRIDDENGAGTGGGGGGGAGTTAGANGNNASGLFNGEAGCGLTGGTGGTGGATAGNGGAGASDPNGCSNYGPGVAGAAGLISTNSQSGGGGGGGASGGEEKKNGGVGGAGGGVVSVYAANIAGGGGGSWGDPGGNGAAGAAGATGIVGATGTIGSSGSAISGYWVLGTAGGNGAAGSGGQGGHGGGGGGGQSCTFCNDGCGSGGGGGGGGGQGGTGGTGGTSGGSTFGVFIFNNGVNGNVVDCQIITGLAGAGGVGGTGSAGGTGGTAGSGSPYTSGEIGAGGNGGKGGNGGTGGTGGSGSSGVALQINVISGSALVLNTSKNMITESTITVDNIACTNVPINHATSVGSPNWSNFGTNSAPSSGIGASVNTAYSTIGRKTIVMNANTYTDFNNIIVPPPTTGNIIASSSIICPGISNFVSSALGTPGFNYSWSVLPAGATIATPTLGATNINFINTTGSPVTYTITLNINSNCCGNLSPVTTTIVVNPASLVPTAQVSGICTGGIATFSATSPIGSGFNWYSDASGTTLLSSNDTYTVGNISAPLTIYLEAINTSGCPSTLTAVTMTPNLISTPTAIPSFSLACDVGPVPVGINPVPNATSYTWYADAAGTTILQNGTSLNYIQNINTPGGSYTVYVQTNIAGCASSVLVPITASVTTTPIFLTTSITPNDTVCSNYPVTFNAMASGGDGTFTYSWSPFSSNSSTPTYSFASSTSVYVDISSNGCTKTFLIPMIIANGNPPALTATLSNIPCGGTATTLDASSTSTNAITYTWYGPNSANILPNVNSPNVVVTDTGNYTIVILDPVNSCSNSVTGYVNYATLTPTITNGLGSGLGCDTGIVTVNVNSAPNSTYNWYADAAGTILLQSGPSSTYGQQIANYGGIYTVYVTGTTPGCIKSVLTPISVSLTPVPIVFTATFIDMPCGQTTSTLMASSSNTNANFSYVWNGNNILSGATTPTAIVGSLGTYTVIGTDAITSCNNAFVGTVNQASINVAAAATPTTGLISLNVALTNQSVGGETFTWYFGDGTSLPTSSISTNPNHTFEEEGTYTVSLIVTLGVCIDTAYVIVKPIGCPKFDFFTPNGDNKNDTYIICGSSKYPNNSLSVFNRWGSLVYFKKAYDNEWNGHPNQPSMGTGLLPSATYFVVFDFGDGITPPFKGYVELKY